MTEQHYVGWWYAIGPDKPLDLSNPAVNIHRVTADDGIDVGCVTVQNACGQTFTVPRDLIAQIAAPAGMTWDRDQRAYVPLALAPSN